MTQSLKRGKLLSLYHKSTMKSGNLLVPQLLNKKLPCYFPLEVSLFQPFLFIDDFKKGHPEGVKHTSPGQRPGNMGTQYVLALKGRNIVNHF